jgi:hypothetical protein
MDVAPAAGMLARPVGFRLVVKPRLRCFEAHKPYDIRLAGSTTLSDLRRAPVLWAR